MRRLPSSDAQDQLRASTGGRLPRQSFHLYPARDRYASSAISKRNQMNMPSHMPLCEELMVCTDCHNPHGGPYAHQLIQPTVNEVCYTCHAEKRGPFLWIHPPVMSDCSNCHEPHGSTNHYLPKISPPRLCQQYHIGTFHPGTPSKLGTVFVFGHSCTNCHANIHGSNSPGDLFLTR